MPTTALPAGTRNTSLNLIDEEYELVTTTTGQAGTFYKEWALFGLQAAAQAGDEVASFMAQQIEHIRKERLRMKHGIVCLLLFGISMQLIYSPMAVLRRPSRRGRRDETSEVVIVIHGSDHGAELRGWA